VTHWDDPGTQSRRKWPLEVQPAKSRSGFARLQSKAGDVESSRCASICAFRSAIFCSAARNSTSLLMGGSKDVAEKIDRAAAGVDPAAVGHHFVSTRASRACLRFSFRATCSSSTPRSGA
jgi:hypothetical protein